MNQMQAFIEKAKKDKELMAKLDTLGASGAEAGKIVALAAEHGFAITAEEYRQAAQTTCPHKKGELKEEDLEAAAGGATKDRWYPDVCNQKTRVEYECVGLLALTWCDHYRREYYGRDRGPNGGECYHVCVKGRYAYEGNGYGDPVL